MAEAATPPECLYLSTELCGKNPKRRQSLYSMLWQPTFPFKTCSSVFRHRTRQWSSVAQSVL